MKREVRDRSVRDAVGKSTLVELDAVHCTGPSTQCHAEYGGAPGLRDRGLVESAAARPKHLASYGQPTVFELAAAYAFGLARNHPFVDGNTRIALVAAFTFLELHGWNVSAEEPAAVLVFLDLAAGEVEEQQLAVWLRENSAKV